MELTRLTAVLCVFLLALCLMLSIITIFSLHQTLQNASRIDSELQGTADSKEPVSVDASTATQEEQSADAAVDILYDRFCMREINGKIAIYTDDGYLIRILEISTATLPEADQQALRDGIFLSSWKEVLALMQDFGKS